MSEEKDLNGGCEENANCKNGGCEQPSEEHLENNASEVATPEAQAEPTWEEKFTAMQDKYLRLVAEFDNFRKRTSRERLDLIMTAGEDIINGLLNIVDDFERAIKAAETTQDVESLREGTKLIHQKLMDYLATKGVKAVESEVGGEFNTDLHDAVTRFPAPDAAHKNKIIDTVQRGYKLNDKVIRYAKVVVGE